MIKKIISFYLFFLIYIFKINSQTISLNNNELIDYLRFEQISGNEKIDYSFNQRPIDITTLLSKNDILKSFYPLLTEPSNKVQLRLLPPTLIFDFNSLYPYNRNNGSMIPNRGYQHLLSFGLFLKYGPLTININPEHLYSQNKEYEGFWEGHYDIIWAKRYQLWNTADIPERFGKKKYGGGLLGQSSIKLEYKNINLSFSNENLWWGPSIRNGIMMSNNARGFKHISLNSINPIRTKIGNFEFQLATGRLENSGFLPPMPERTYAGQQIYVPKINQLGNANDWRYFQGLNVNYSPSFIQGFSIGISRWVQMYSALVEGKYYWMEGKTNYFPIFNNIFRKNDLSSDIEEQTDQAASIYFRWVWEDSNAEIYTEFAYNDAKQNLRDLLVDTDHSRAVTVGLQKFFKKNNILFSWEWTQMEQTAGRLVRTAGSWYRHYYVYHGFTNYGEIMGSSIGPGSNSHFFSISKIEGLNNIALSFEIVDQDNDFYYLAFEDSQDYRRMWKDYNLHLKYQKQIKNFLTTINLVFIRSLNYQWQLDDKSTKYYTPGRDLTNFHLGLKIQYQIPIN
tara:strand:- start:182 stop:1873 length:1692 start_codon:yes stop_codon:yes gene_type:complete